MIKALITGMTGMVGSHLADYLLRETDWDIYGMQRWRSPLDNIEHLRQSTPLFRKPSPSLQSERLTPCLPHR